MPILIVAGFARALWNADFLSCAFLNGFRYLPGKELKSTRQIVNGEVQGFGDFGERFHRNLVLRSFHISDVVPRKIGFFRKLFLTPSHFSSFSANRLA
jgi:hypothetical protein